MERKTPAKNLQGKTYTVFRATNRKYLSELISPRSTGHPNILTTSDTQPETTRNESPHLIFPNFKVTRQFNSKPDFANGSTSQIKKTMSSTNRNLAHEYAIKRAKSAEDLEKTVKLLDYITHLREVAQQQQEGLEKGAPNKHELRKAVKALKILSEQDSPYLDLMGNFTKIIERGLFAQPSFFNQCHAILDDVQNYELSRLICKTVPNIPYYAIAVLLIEELRIQKLSAEESLLTKERINQDLREKNQSLEEQMQFLVKETNEKIILNLKRQHQKELEALLERNEQLVELIETAQKDLAQSQQDMISLKVNYDKTLDEVYSLKRTINEKNSEIQLHEQEVKKTRKSLAELQGRVGGFRDLLDSILVQLNTIKFKTLELRHNKDEAEKEMENLKMRAAVGFEELTPRPNYKQIMQERNMDLNFRSEANFVTTSKDYNKPRLSTQQAFEGLLNKYWEQSQRIKALEIELQGQNPTASPLASKRNSRFTVNVKRVGRLGSDHSAAPSPYLKPTQQQGIVLNIPDKRTSSNFSQMPSMSNADRSPIPSNFSLSRKISSMNFGDHLEADKTPIITLDLKEIGKESQPVSRIDIIKNSEPSTPRDKLSEDGKTNIPLLPDKPLFLNIADSLNLQLDSASVETQVVQNANTLLEEITQAKKMVENILS